MPRTPHGSTGVLGRVLFLLAVGIAFAIRGRNERDVREIAIDRRDPAPASPEPRPVTVRIGRIELEPWEEGKRPRFPKRVALATTFATIFFAGAALTAGAGDQAVKLLETDTTTTTEAVAEAAPADAAEAAPTAAAAPAAEDVEPAPAPSSALAPEPAPAPASEPASTSAGSSQPWSETGASAPALAPKASSSKQWAPAAASDARSNAVRGRSRSVAGFQRHVGRAPSTRPQPRPAQLDPEVHADGTAAVVWLNRALPDPTPRAKRLERSFARQLVRTSRAAGADWALVLGVLRAEGALGSVPATRAELRTLARRLAAASRGRDEWNAVLAVSGRTSTADEATALARYHRAVGTEALVVGLAAQKSRLIEKLLRDSRVSVYAGGRNDLVAGRIDVRIVVLIRYLAEAHGQVTVSSLFSGHGMYARKGVVSAHVYGHAVDISALGGLPITGNQAPGSVTEEAVRAILLLPSQLQPRQVISLLGLGGASFPLADHYDHIHVGY